VSNIADISAGRARLRITGADRVDFLHGQCTNDIKRLRPGESCYAAFLNAKGKMRGDAYIVYRGNEFLLDASLGLQASLEKFVITEDVVIEDVSDEWKASLVVGGGGQGITFAHALGTGLFGRERLPVTVEAGQLEVLRIEAGVPKWGVDMDENTIPVEAGLVTAISYEKGCYIGQETIERIKTYGHVNRQLVQLALTVAGEKILAGEKEIGTVTSVAHSNRLGKLVALGYVRREFATRGTKLRVGEQPAEVLKVCGD